jgi:hypothetical protein
MFIDTGGGVGRFKLDDAARTETAPLPSHDASVRTFTSPVDPAAPISMTATPNALVPVTRVIQLDMAEDARSVGDSSGVKGIDEYRLAETSQRGRGDGPFRGALNAGNVLYTSLSQIC